MELAGSKGGVHWGLKLLAIHASWLGFSWSLSQEISQHLPCLSPCFLATQDPWGSQGGYHSSVAPRGCCGSLCILSPAVGRHPRCLLAVRAFSSSPLPLAWGLKLVPSSQPHMSPWDLWQPG